MTLLRLRYGRDGGRYRRAWKGQDGGGGDGAGRMGFMVFACGYYAVAMPCARGCVELEPCGLGSGHEEQVPRGEDPAADGCGAFGCYFQGATSIW